MTHALLCKSFSKPPRPLVRAKIPNRSFLPNGDSSELHDGRGYEELFPHTLILTDGTSEIRVLDLETLIDVKAAAGRARDKLVLPILLALRDRSKPGR